MARKTPPHRPVLNLISSISLLLAANAGAETVAHWRFEERTSGAVPAGNWGSVGDTVLDSSGKGNHMQTWDTGTAPAYTNLLGPLAAAVHSPTHVAL